MPEEITAPQKVSEAKDADDIGDKFKGLATQIQAEYKLGWLHQEPKIAENLIRLKLYNNQRRDKKAVGDTTLFTTFQTVFASLYIDRLTVEFGGIEEGDEETAENLDAMAKRDYVDMEKDEVDFDWIWDTLWCGRGLIMFHEWIRDPKNKIFLPIPENMDFLSFLRDPRATSVNGNRMGRGAARFFGRPIKMTKQDIEDHPHIFFSDFRTIKIGGGTRELLQRAQEARDTAQNRQIQKKEDEKSLGPNAEYDITEWHTHYKTKGKIEKVKVWLANERAKVIGFQVLKSETKRVLWPVIDRPLYPTAHDWDGTSIPDLVEDKQRGRAVAQNLAFRAMKADVLPNYIYDSNKITNRKHLISGAFNKYIPMDSKGEKLDTAIMPLIKARPNMVLLDFIYNSLEASAQKATATPELKQGMLSEKQRTLGEINIVSSEADTRYSLAAKVFGWSEKRFWRQWYRLYKENFKENIDEKILRIKGAFGPKWRPLGRDNIITDIDPDVKIESKIIARTKQLEERNSLMQYFGFVFQDPTVNRRWGEKKLGKLHGLEKDEIERLLPPTIDERVAEDENDRLNKNEVVPVLREDDHNVHLEMHSKAGDTPATNVHIETHKQALMWKKMAPELFPEEPEEVAFTSPGAEKITPPGAEGATKPIAPSRAPGAAIPPA